jgi:hypothetical protein
MDLAHRDQAHTEQRRRPTIFLARLVAVASVLTLAATAVAAPVDGRRVEPPKPTNRPMRVVIITDSRAGCEPSCPEWISAQGEITMDTPAQFQRVFKALGQKKLPIFISSPGGAVVAALTIGREIRKRGLDVAVERTVFQKCEQSAAACDLRALKDGDKGRPEPIGAQCASSCVFILAAGTERVVPVYGFVGVHEHFAFQTIRRVLRTYQVQRRFENGRIVEQRKLVAEKLLSSTTIEKDPNYAPVRTYFTEMGINTAVIMPLLLGTPRKDIHRMTPNERGTTRLVTRVAAGDGLLQTALRPADSKLDMPIAASWRGDAPLSKVVAELMLFYPPGGDTVDIFVRVKPSDVPLRTAQFIADVQFADGRKLTARSTGDDAADPLYAALATQEFCALRSAGDLSMKVSLDNAARPGSPLQMTADLANINGAAQFAARHCSK